MLDHSQDGRVRPPRAVPVHQGPATVFYAASIAAAGLAEAAVWLHALVSALVIRRLEPPETDPPTTENGDPSKPQ